MLEFILWVIVALCSVPILGLIFIPMWNYWRSLSSDDKIMAVLWIGAMVGIGFIVGWENISIGFPQGTE
jgi:ABC-type Fe3+ transport system permease subunit